MYRPEWVSVIYFLFWVVLWSDIFAMVWETNRVQFARVMYYLWKWEFFKCFCYFQNWSRADKSSGVWHKIEGFSVSQSERFIWYFRQSEMTWQLSHPSLMWVYWSETINFVDDDGFGSRYLLNSDHLTNFNYDKALWASQDGNDKKCHDDKIRFVIPSKLSSIGIQLILSTNEGAPGSSG